MLIMPGGFGVAKNFCDFALYGEKGEITVEAEVERVLKEFNEVNIYIYNILEIKTNRTVLHISNSRSEGIWEEIWREGVLTNPWNEGWGRLAKCRGYRYLFP